MTGAFSAMLGTLMGDPNLAISIVYTPKSGDTVTCSAVFAEPDVETQLQNVKVRDRKRILIVRAADIDEPEENATIEISAGGTLYRVLAYRASDPLRQTWKIEAALL